MDLPVLLDCAIRSAVDVLQDNKTVGICTLVIAAAVLLIWCSMMLRLLGGRRKSLVWTCCWFCHQNAKVASHKQNNWVCPHCQQYNGFNEDGDFNKLLPEMFATPKTSEIHRIGDGSNTWPGFKSPFKLCDPCQRRQLLKTRQLASFVPVRQASYDDEVSIYKAQLEANNGLCGLCQKGLCAHLGWQDLQIATYYTTEMSASTDSTQKGNINKTERPAKEKKALPWLLKFTRSFLPCELHHILTLMLGLFLECHFQRWKGTMKDLTAIVVVLSLVAAKACCSSALSLPWISLECFLWCGVILSFVCYDRAVPWTLGIVAICLIEALPAFRSLLSWLKARRNVMSQSMEHTMGSGLPHISHATESTDVSHDVASDSSVVKACSSQDQRDLQCLQMTHAGSREVTDNLSQLSLGRDAHPGVSARKDQQKQPMANGNHLTMTMLQHPHNCAHARLNHCNGVLRPARFKYNQNALSKDTEKPPVAQEMSSSYDVSFQQTRDSQSVSNAGSRMKNPLAIMLVVVLTISFSLNIYSFVVH